MIRPATTRPPTPPSRPVPAPALPEGLLTRFLGKRVAVRLAFGDEVAGVLSTIGRYELVVTMADGPAVVIFKGAVASVREAPGA